MATIAKHVDQYAIYLAHAWEGFNDYKMNPTPENFNYYERYYDRLQIAAQVLIDLGIDVKHNQKVPDPHSVIGRE